MVPIPRTRLRPDARRFFRRCRLLPHRYHSTSERGERFGPLSNSPAGPHNSYGAGRTGQGRSRLALPLGCVLIFESLTAGQPRSAQLASAFSPLPAGNRRDHFGTINLDGAESHLLPAGGCIVMPQTVSASGNPAGQTILMRPSSGVSSSLHSWGRRDALTASQALTLPRNPTSTNHAPPATLIPSACLVGRINGVLLPVGVWEWSVFP